jgi:hypothetical protein
VPVAVVVEKHLEQFDRGSGITIGTVTALKRDIERPTQFSETIRWLAGYQFTAQPHGAERPTQEFPLYPIHLFLQKAKVEQHVMGYKDGSLADLVYAIGYLIEGGGVGYHFVGNAG